MTISIKKEDWKDLAPKVPYQARVYKNELPVIKYNRRAKTVKEHTGRVVGICICTLSGKVFSLAKGIHASVCEYYGVNPEEVEKTGWELDNGNYVWR